MSQRFEIDRREFISCIKSLQRFSKQKDEGDCILSIEVGKLVISLLGQKVFITAKGELSGSLRVSFNFLCILSKNPFITDQICFEVGEEKLSVGGMSVRCKVQSGKLAEILFPVNASNSP